MKLTLANGQDVEVSQEEMGEFITQLIIPNPDWHHSKQLTEREVVKYLQSESSPDELKKVAKYLIIYIENLAFSAYLFAKAEGKSDESKEFNIPALKKLRKLYHKATETKQSAKELAGDLYEMENVCLEIGADPL